MLLGLLSYPTPFPLIVLCSPRIYLFLFLKCTLWVMRFLWSSLPPTDHQQNDSYSQMLSPLVCVSLCGLADYRGRGWRNKMLFPHHSCSLKEQPGIHTVLWEKEIKLAYPIFENIVVSMMSQLSPQILATSRSMFPEAILPKLSWEHWSLKNFKTKSQHSLLALCWILFWV